MLVVKLEPVGLAKLGELLGVGLPEEVEKWEAEIMIGKER